MPDVQPVYDQEYSYNRIAPLSLFESTEIKPYSFGPYEMREAVLLFNERNVKAEEFAVDYMI